MTDENMIEAMARAMYGSYQFKKGWEHPDTVRIHHRHMTVAVTAALAAYRQCTGDDGK